MPRTTKPPACRLYKRTGQAVVTLNGRDHYLGKYGTGVSRQAYDRLVGEWLTGGRSLPAKDAPLTITEQELSRTAVYRIDIDHWTGKKEEVAAGFPGAFMFDQPPERAAWPT